MNTHEFTNVGYEEGCKCWTCRAAAVLNEVPMSNSSDGVVDVVDLVTRLMVMVGNGDPQEVMEVILPAVVRHVAATLGVTLAEVQVIREAVH